MAEKYTEAILHQPISQLDFSREFKSATLEWGLSTLAELLAHKPRNLTKLPGFNERMLHEFVAFLEKHRLGHYLN